jgi:hypothetical protein
MRLSPIAAMAALALWSAIPGNAGAGPVTSPDESGVAIGVGLICNTPEQMQRLISLRNGGQQMPQAVNVVNNEAKDPRACGIAAVAFMSDKLVGMKEVDGKLVQIMRINVVAAFDGQHWSKVPAMTQYALIEPEGYSI